MKCNLVNENFRENYLENLLHSRGVDNIEDFLDPDESYLQNPSDLKNIGQASALYLRIIKKENPNILLVVDSDVDGFTSATIIYNYTKRLNPNCNIDYLLHEGKQHGLQDHIDNVMNSNINYDLIILPDSSSNDINYHNMLDEINLPCLVLDHHEVDVKLSDNAIVVNNQLSPKYKNKELTGAGVVYQFCRYIDTMTSNNIANEFMDLAAWGIIGDMGSVIEMENRYIIKNGIKNINNYFMKCLLEKQGYSITGKKDPSWEDIIKKTNPISIAFYIVPLVNALIRVGSMDEKKMLFLAFINGKEMVPCNKRGAKGTMEEAAIEVVRICNNARTKQNKFLDNAMFDAEVKINKYDLLENRILFLRLEEEDFPPEINGLLAMKLSAQYKRPTIVARMGDDGFDKGSMRGLNQSELRDFKAFLTNSGYFEWCQGHANAAGACIKDSNLSAFHKYANDALKDIDFGEECYDVNFERYSSDLDLGELITDLCSENGIWGQKNNEPLIYIKGLNITKKDIKIMGSNADTLKIEINGISFIKFKAKDLIDDINSMEGTFKLEFVGRPNLNEYYGRVTPQLYIGAYEIKPYNPLLEF